MKDLSCGPVEVGWECLVIIVVFLCGQSAEDCPASQPVAPRPRGRSAAALPPDGGGLGRPLDAQQGGETKR
jgi:hypothetical protein